LVLKHDSWKVAEFTADVDPTDTKELRQLLYDAIKRYDGRTDYIEEYEMEVYYAGKRDKIMTFVARE
jgi:hypothetical protein